LASTDCIVRYNRKIESVSEDRSIGPFAHLCLDPHLHQIKIRIHIKVIGWVQNWIRINLQPKCKEYGPI
jgi:hypothetical protein